MNFQESHGVLGFYKHCSISAEILRKPLRSTQNLHQENPVCVCVTVCAWTCWCVWTCRCVWCPLHCTERQIKVRHKPRVSFRNLQGAAELHGVTNLHFWSFCCNEKSWPFTENLLWNCKVNMHVEVEWLKSGLVCFWEDLGILHILCT